MGFGVFLVVLKVGSTHGLVWQLIFSRMASSTFAVGVVIWLSCAQAKMGRRGASKRAKIASCGLLDPLVCWRQRGVCFICRSASEGRLDVAAVLASLYPVVTIVLAAWFLKERTTSSQALGMALALGAVVLVSL